MRFAWIILSISISICLAGRSEICQAKLHTAPQVEVPIRIKLQPKAFVDKPYIEFSDIGTCYGPQGICEQVPAINIGWSPLPGKTKRLGCEMVRQILIKEMPKVDIAIDCPKFLQLKSASGPINKNDVMNAVMKSVKVAKDEKFRLKFNKIFLIGNPRIWPGEVAYKVSSDMAIDSLIDLRRTFSQPILVEAWQEEFMVSRFKVRLDYELMLPILVTKASIAKGHEITHDHVELKWLSKNNPRQYLNKITPSQVAKRDIAQGTALTRFHLRQKFMVEKGQNLSLESRSEGLSIMMRGAAMKSGTKGGVIKVRLGTGKIVMAKVIAPGKGEILP